MIELTPTTLAVAGARTGIAPAHLLDVQDMNGNLYYWSDRKVQFPAILAEGSPNYLPWLLAAGPFTFNRSTAMDTGTFTIQNVSGNTLARDVETMLSSTTLEGATFVYRLWQADAQQALLYITGTLTFQSGTDTTATFKTKPFSNPSESNAPSEQYCETCQLDWGGARCGATGTTECQYSFQSCQVPERIMVALNHYEKNWGETSASNPFPVINRNRRI
ncbi:MAG: hypothetical protein P4K83_02070 [Terracidiphilus sp.]|nr:hypothetical protein [Terracidiphilus sp.]